MNTSIVAVRFLVLLGGASVGTAAYGWWRVHKAHARHASARRIGILAGMVASLLALATVADGINSYYSYIPTAAALFGQRAHDEASRAAVLREQALPHHLTHGLVEQVHIPGTRSHFHARSAQVYLPPAWFTSPRPPLPVVELLHGTPGTTSDWTRAGEADLTADRWAAQHGGLAPVIVMADENGGFFQDTECVDSRGHGHAETYLTGDVPAWVTSHLGTVADRSGWAIAGSSEGGYCALQLALRHRDVYSVFIDMSGKDRPTFRGGLAHLLGRDKKRREGYLPAWLLSHLPPGPPLAGWFEVGGADHGTTREVVRMARLSAQHGVDVRLVLVPDAHHSWGVWRRSFQDAFGWTATHLGLAPGSAGAEAAGARHSPTATRNSQSAAPHRHHGHHHHRAGG